MTRKGRKRRSEERAKPRYDLAEVKKLVSRGRVRITRGAQDAAWEDFGWGIDNILDVLMRLHLKHFYKQDVCQFDRYMVFDFYKAKGLKGENVYTHFYIDDADNMLIVNSFKRV